VDVPRLIDPARLRGLDAVGVLEMTPDIAIVSDLEGIIVYGNRALEERVGQTLDELIGRPAADLIHPEDLAPARPAWQDLVAGKYDQLELALRFGSTATGWRWCLGSVGIDRELGLSIGTYQETTALREAEERFRRAFEDAGIGMAITSLKGRVVRVNRSLAEMLRRAPEDLAGMRVSDITHPDHRAEDDMAMRRLAAGGIDVHRAEKRYLRPDGSEA